MGRALGRDRIKFADLFVLTYSLAVAGYVFFAGKPVPTENYGSRWPLMLFGQDKLRY